MEPPRYCHLSLVSQSVSPGGTGRCKVKKSVDILPRRGGGYLTGVARGWPVGAARRCACLVGAEYVTITLAVMCATVMAADAAAAFSLRYRVLLWGSCDPERVRVIRIARLRTLPPVHLRPIDVVVYNDPWMEILSWGGLRA